MLFDTHCHLDTSMFDADRSTVLQRAREAGVQWLINPGFDCESSRRAVALAGAEESVFAAVGIHPNDCHDWSNDTASALREMARHPRVVAIGEIGLDYHWQKTTTPQQQRAFVEQIALARELNLPFIVHCREAYDDCLALLRAHARESLAGQQDRHQGGGGARDERRQSVGVSKSGCFHDVTHPAL